MRGLEAFCALFSFSGAPTDEKWLRDTLATAYGPLEAAGVLCHHAPADQVLCAQCFEQHWLPVEWDEVRRQQIALCPVAGETILQDEQVRMVSVDLDRCLALLQMAFVNDVARVRELVPGKTWYLGIATTENIDWNVIVVVAALDADDLSRLIDETAKLPRCQLDVLLTPDARPFPRARLARPLHALPLTEVADWQDGRIIVRRVALLRWLQRFLEDRREPRRGGGRPASKTAWLHEVFPRFEDQLAACKTDTDRHQLLSQAYREEAGDDSISRTTVIKFLDEVMRGSVRN